MRFLRVLTGEPSGPRGERSRRLRVRLRVPEVVEDGRSRARHYHGWRGVSCPVCQPDAYALLWARHRDRSKGRP